MRIKFWLSFATSIAWAALVITMFLALAGCAVSEEAIDKQRVDEANWLNCARAKRELNWAPKVKLEQGIARTVEFFLSGAKR